MEYKVGDKVRYIGHLDELKDRALTIKRISDSIFYQDRKFLTFEEIRGLGANDNQVVPWHSPCPMIMARQS